MWKKSRVVYLRVFIREWLSIATLKELFSTETQRSAL